MGATANIVRNALRRKNLLVITDKIVSRLFDARSGSPEEVRKWCEHRREDLASFANEIDPGLWSEAREFAAHLEAVAREKLSAAHTSFGGGGAIDLLYFLTRLKKPSTIVETGVAAGWSSAAFLAAIEKNQTGMLFSSDFPYFRQDKPDDEIGILVDQALRKHWQLFKDGDQFNLPRILARTSKIELFHYDSDKSYRGRRRAIKIVGRKLAPGAVVIFDDIQDNFHFRDYVNKRKCACRVFSVGGKYVGVIGV